MVVDDPANIRSIIEKCEDKNLRMLFKAAYLLGATQAEMLGEHYSSDSKSRVYAQTGDDVKEDAIRVKDTIINVIRFTIRTERKKGKETRTVLLPRDCELWAKELYDHYKLYGNNPVFPFTRQKIYIKKRESEIFNGLEVPVSYTGTTKWIPLRLNDLREVREKELVDKFSFKEEHLKVYGIKKIDKRKARDNLLYGSTREELEKEYLWNLCNPKTEEKEFNPTFENGGFWEYYKDIERQFDNFLVGVPYLKGNEKTYSFRLANLLLVIGAHIDSAFKEMTMYSPFASKYPEILNPKTKDGRARQPNITDYYPLSVEYKLSEKVVMFKCLPTKESVMPFQQFQKVATKKGGERIEPPYWWTDYNGVKHEFSKKFNRAKLKTVRDALAAAFLLNVIHDPAALHLCRLGLLKPKYPQGTTIFAPVFDTFKGEKLQSERPTDKQVEDPFIIETSLFLYDYERLTNLKSTKV